jgi:shikimate kinase
MENTLILIGMSGIGKSHYSKRLTAKYGHKVISVDDLIAEELGRGNVQDVSKFLGHPYEDGYKERCDQYLKLEEKFTNHALDYAENRPDELLIIDPTGSMVYLPPETLNRFSKFKNTIYLDVDDSKVDKMIEKYFADPKPVIWGEFNNFTEENFKERILEQYPKLLNKRRELYAKHSKIAIPYSDHEDGLLDVKEWLEH